MTNLDHNWWREVAPMSRRELLDAYVLETERNSDLQGELETAQDELEAEIKAQNEVERLRESVFVAYSAAEAALSRDRMGLNNKFTVVATNFSEGGNALRGRKLEPEHVLMVPGWGRGQFAEKTKLALAACGVNWANLRYAPSPETDRAEGLSNWGRTEAAIVDDTLGTLNDLLSRALERTAEKPEPSVGTKTGRMKCSEPNLSRLTSDSGRFDLTK